jgi:hypothetical protein
MQFNTPTSGSIMTPTDTSRFIDDFVNVDRPLPDFSLLMLLASRRSTADTYVEAACDELILTYVLGLAIPALSVLEGVVWKPGDVN